MKGRRIVFTADAKLKFTKAEASKNGSIGTIGGYAIVWNAVSSDRGGFAVRLLPNSAQFCTPTFALYHHDFAAPLGDTDTATLRLTPDEIGIWCDIDLPDTTTGRDVQELVRTGRAKGMSFAMLDPADCYESTENGQTILNFKSYQVDEVTVTAIPAFTQTSIGVVPVEGAEGIGPQELSQQSVRLAKLRLEMCRN